jgi:DNA-damage-inducible protein D
MLYFCRGDKQMTSDYSECVTGLEGKKKFMDTGVEYWMARDLMPLLAYASWDKFEGVIEKAREAARSAGAPVENHFSQTGNMVPIGSGAQRKSGDWYLSRYACYLIAMNADSSKPQVGHAMTYFAGKTRQMELLEKQLTEQQERVRFRIKTIANNKRLFGAAKRAGVIHYDRFQDAGYRGLYGMGVADVKQYKGIPPKQELLDRIGSLELSAHDFRIKVTEDRLSKSRTRDELTATDTHRQVGEEVRAVMRGQHGSTPEDLPIAPSIKKLVHQHRKQIKDSDEG